MKLFNRNILFLFLLIPVIGVISCRNREKNDAASFLENNESSYRDIYPDTWVANDALGRTMPDLREAGPIKTDQRRVVGIFYVTWHRDSKNKLKSPYTGDVTRILKSDPTARLDANSKLWSESYYHWGEPEVGYFLSKDEYVIRKDMSMLSDAGVDVLILDVTNGVRYWDEWDTLFRVMKQMKSEGNKVPMFCFWAFNGQVINVVQDLYERVYMTKKYKDLWFYWDGKPLLLYNSNPSENANGKDKKNPNPKYDPKTKTDPANPHYGDPAYTTEFLEDYSKEVKVFFTLRTMWWGYYEWYGKRFIGTEDNWSFGYDLGDKRVQNMSAGELLSRHDGQVEEAAVTPAQHSISLIGKSWSRQYGEPPLNQYYLPDSAFVPWLGKTVKHPEGYGIYFQERWDEALEADPQFLYINDWNEWIAGKFHPKNGNTMKFMGRDSHYYFVDQYNAEFNRTIQPMKDGYTDNYYMQMARNIRRYKGARPLPELHGYMDITIDGNFDDWEKDTMEYRDTKGDVFHRDYDGYGGFHYTNNSGRNDIITSKLAVNSSHVYFYVETTDPLSDNKGKNWMLLLIDADKNPQTGWYGYDFLINKKVKGEKITTLMRYDISKTENQWQEVADLAYRWLGNRLELEVPRELLGLTDDQFTFDFKWTDNPTELEDPISLCTHGDTAPNRRFNYRLIWKK